MRHAPCWFLALVSLAAPGPARDARAEIPSQRKEEAPLIVEGVVREVFRNQDDTNVDYVVEIQAASTAVGKPSREAGRLALPSPGEPVYVHVFQRRPDAPKVPSASGHDAIPAEKASIRAYLYPRPQGGWQGAYPDWFDPKDGQVAGAVKPRREPTPRDFGLRLALLKVKAGNVLQVAEVTADSPAARAGIAAGDLVLGVNGKEPESLEQVDQLVKQGGDKLKLSVIDLKKNQPVEIALDLSSTPNGTAEADAGAAHTRVIGVKVETARNGKLEAVRVVRLMPDGPAAKAGIEVGDIITEVDGHPTATTAQLNDAVRQGGATLKLLVVDKNSGKKVPVEVVMGKPVPDATKPSKPAPTDAAPTAPRGSKAPLGVSVDFDIVDGASGLKILEVQPDSPARRAGLEKGQVIIDANDTIALNDEQLDEIVKKSGASLKLKVFDPATGKKSVVEVKLGEGR